MPTLRYPKISVIVKTSAQSNRIFFLIATNRIKSKTNVRVRRIAIYE